MLLPINFCTFAIVCIDRRSRPKLGNRFLSCTSSIVHCLRAAVDTDVRLLIGSDKRRRSLPVRRVSCWAARCRTRRTRRSRGATSTVRRARPSPPLLQRSHMPSHADASQRSPKWPAMIWRRHLQTHTNQSKGKRGNVSILPIPKEGREKLKERNVGDVVKSK